MTGFLDDGGVELLGMLAGTMTTLAYVPQVLKVWRERSARDISWGAFALLSGGIVVWLVYGALIGSLALIAANIVTLALTSAILVAALRFGRKSGRNTPQQTSD